MSLLYHPLTSVAWRSLAKTSKLPPEEQPVASDQKHWAEGGLRIFELQQAGRRNGCKALLEMDRLLTAAEVHWLTQQRTIPRKLLRKVVASLKVDKVMSSDTIIRIEQQVGVPLGPDAVQAEETISPEAVAFFRRCYPRIARSEPAGDFPVLARWWLKEQLETVLASDQSLADKAKAKWRKKNASKNKER